MSTSLGVKIGHWYKVECFGADGALKWVEEFPNLVVNVGLTEILEQFYNGSTYTAAHFVMLKDNADVVAASDTMSSHATWVEIHTQYSEGTRPALTMNAAASQSIDNVGGVSVFTITGTATIAGACITTNSTKNGTTGVLIGGNDFSADRAVVNGDTLNVTVTASMTSS